MYIDPPFATRQEFKSRYGETAYQDVIAGARFLEFLRKRLVFLREFLANNGSIFVHCDWHLGHYTRILLDEIFGKNNFRNEINVKRTAKHTAMQFEKVKSLQVATNSIFVYAKRHSTVFNKPYKEASERQKAGSWHGFSDNCYRPTMRYKLFGLLPPSHRGRWIWEKIRAEKALENYKLFEKALSKGEVSSFEEFAYNNPGMEFVRRNNGSPQYWIAARERIMSDTSWTDIQAYAHLFDFPTEKSELLIERVINMGSNPGDIILDAFAGSGTTAAVAEKLGRRW
ncbi:MAG: site-specific DNA-methyltransferase, partial [Methanophagales archaeon]|nr:site-specific DNA-methyltransferase [Methanophagales archaeon]